MAPASTSMPHAALLRLTAPSSSSARFSMGSTSDVRISAPQGVIVMLSAVESGCPLERFAGALRYLETGGQPLLSLAPSRDLAAGTVL